MKNEKGFGGEASCCGAPIFTFAKKSSDDPLKKAPLGKNCPSPPERPASLTAIEAAAGCFIDTLLPAAYR